MDCLLHVLLPPIGETMPLYISACYQLGWTRNVMNESFTSSRVSHVDVEQAALKRTRPRPAARRLGRGVPGADLLGTRDRASCRVSSCVGFVLSCTSSQTFRSRLYSHPSTANVVFGLIKGYSRHDCSYLILLGPENLSGVEALTITICDLLSQSHTPTNYST